MKQVDRGEVELISPEMNMKLNTDKRVVFDALMGYNWSSLERYTALPQLIEKFFKGRVNQEFTNYDLSILAGEVTKSSSTVEVSSKTNKALFVSSQVIKGNYNTFRRVKQGYHVQSLNEEEIFCGAIPKCFVGASSVDHAVWFHFINDAQDVCNGAIYMRTSPVKKLTKVSTFEINPFIASGLPQESGLVSSSGEKPQMTWNPNWLVHTLSNMEKHIFSKLIA